MSVDLHVPAPAVDDDAGRELVVVSTGAIGIVEARLPDKWVVRVGDVVSDVPIQEGVPLPRVGDLVEIQPALSGMVRGHWISVVKRSWHAPGVPLTVRILSGLNLVEHPVLPVGLNARDVVTAVAGPEVRDVALCAARACAEADRLRVEHEGWKARLNEAANEFAESAGLCERFDEFMTEWGFEGRQADYTVSVEVTGRVYVTCTGRSAEEAEGNVSREDVLEVLKHAEVEWDWETDSAERA